MPSEVRPAELEALREAEFPVTRHGIYLDHATLGPPPARALRAASELMERMTATGLPDLFELATDGADRVRAKAARLLASAPDAIAFVSSTSQGVNLVAEGLEWRPGDEVIAYDLDHPAAVVPWLNLARHGVEVRFVRDAGRHGFEAADVEALMTARTRAVAVSLVNFATGTRADVEAVGALCRDRGAWLVVDAAQAMGALAIDAPALGADVVVAHAYKFLLAGFGIGVCHLSTRALDELALSRPGWKSVVDPFDVERILAFRVEPAPGGRRFEPSWPALPQLFALERSLDLFLEVGTDEVEALALAAAGRLATGLHDLGAAIAGPQALAPRSAIVSAAFPDGLARRFAAARDRLRVSCAERDGRVRLAPHFYTSPDEIDELLAAV